MFLPSLLSKDVFDYMVQGRILAIHGANPFVTPAQTFAADDFVRAMGWPQFTTLYGPAWVSAAGILAFVSPGTVGGSLLVYKLLFAVVHLLNGGLVGALRRGGGRPGCGRAPLPLEPADPPPGLRGRAQRRLPDDVGAPRALLPPARGQVGDRNERALAIICLTVSILVKYVTAPFLLFALAAQIGRGRDGRHLLKVRRSRRSSPPRSSSPGFLPYLGGMDLMSSCGRTRWDTTRVDPDGDEHGGEPLLPFRERGERSPIRRRGSWAWRRGR